jgi:hypothetical protein
MLIIGYCFGICSERLLCYEVHLNLAYRWFADWACKVRFRTTRRFRRTGTGASATEVTPKFVSPADPAARSTGAHGGQAFFAYSTNYLIDLDHAVIVYVTTAHPPSRSHGSQDHD